MQKDLFSEEFPHKLHYNDKNLLGINEYSNDIILDFFDMVSYICYTDFYTPRDEDVNNLRKLTVTIPVNNYKTFNSIKNDMEKLLTYMTNGEKWNITFVENKSIKFLSREQRVIRDNTKYNSIALLSGGLDSMAGSVLEKDNNTIFVTYETNSIEVNNSNEIYENLIKNEKNNHVIIGKIKHEEDEHYTERTRSLMFIATSLIYADYYKIENVKIYENGIMSLNPKFNFSRRVTKTTNQKTLYLINNILDKLDIKIKVTNPFKYKTKGEIIKIIPNANVEYIRKQTRTCAKHSGVVHFRNKNKGNFHCGICTACVLRQIGETNSNMNGTDYLVPINLYNLKDILEYENKISKNNDKIKDEKAAVYKYNEKRSLLEYYRLYYDKIQNSEIYNYLDLKKEYYEDENWIKNIENMLKQFCGEVDIYFKSIKGWENK